MNNELISQSFVPLVVKLTSSGSMVKVALSAATRSAENAATAIEERIVKQFAWW